VTKRETDDTLRQIEQTQELLKQSIDESRKLATKTQTLLDKHRKEVDAAD
jgi:hypothetical protein